MKRPSNYLCGKHPHSRTYLEIQATRTFAHNAPKPQKSWLGTIAAIIFCSVLFLLVVWVAIMLPDLVNGLALERINMGVGQ